MRDHRCFVFVAAVAAFGSFACEKASTANPTSVGVAEVAEAVTSAAVVPVNRVEVAEFSLVWSAQPAPPGQSVQGTLTLTAKSPFKCNQEYPHKLKLSGEGARPAHAEIIKSQMQVGLDRVVIPVSYTVEKAGPAALEALLAFSVCTDEKCLIERQAIRLSVEASAAADTPAVPPVGAPPTATAEPPSQKNP